MLSPRSNLNPNSFRVVDGWKFPTVNYVIELHKKNLAVSEGKPGILSMENLQSALSAPESQFGGYDPYPTLFDKIGEIAFRIVNNHAFVDGNKRAAYAVLATTLAWNDYKLRWDQDTIVCNMVAIANKEISREELTKRIREGCVLYSATTEPELSE